MASLFNLLKYWIQIEGSTKQHKKALAWISDHMQELKKYSKNWYTNEIIDIYKEYIE
jgi:hypothetical protein